MSDQRRPEHSKRPVIISVDLVDPSTRRRTLETNSDPTPFRSGSQPEPLLGTHEIETPATSPQVGRALCVVDARAWLQQWIRAEGVVLPDETIIQGL